MMTPPSRSLVMPPLPHLDQPPHLMPLPVNPPNILLHQFSESAQPKRKQKLTGALATLVTSKLRRIFQSGIINNFKLIYAIFFTFFKYFFRSVFLISDLT
jgi:hypothetical protein